MWLRSPGPTPVAEAREQPMSDSQTPKTDYLRSSDKGHRKDWAALARLCVAAGGPSPWRQLGHLLRLAITRSRFTAGEYYRLALWNSGIDAANLARFVAEADRTAFNDALHRPGRAADEAAVMNKLETEMRLLAAGLPVTRTLAVSGYDGQLPPDTRRLHGPAEVDAFLADPGVYPLFLKPRTGSFARGTAGAVGVEGDIVRLSNGVAAPRAALVDEIAAAPDGYLFQPLMRAAPELARHAGKAMPSMRVATLRTETGPELWYVTIKLPSPTQMSDGGSVNMRIMSEVDPATGRALRWRRIGSPLSAVPDHWADREVPLSELRLPGVRRAVDLCLAGHGLFPALGTIGWDVFLTPDGPVLNEANANPFPTIQGCRADGIRAGDVGAAYERALAAARRPGG